MRGAPRGRGSEARRSAHRCPVRSAERPAGNCAAQLGLPSQSTQHGQQRPRRSLSHGSGGRTAEGKVPAGSFLVGPPCACRRPGSRSVRTAVSARGHSSVCVPSC